MRTDKGRTDITKLIVDFRNFVKTCLKTNEDKEDNGNKYENDRDPDYNGRRYPPEIRTCSRATRFAFCYTLCDRSVNDSF